MHQVLAVDVGGTKIHAATVSLPATGAPQILQEWKIPSQELRDLPQAFDRILGSATNSWGAVAIGIAGPKNGKAGHVTNLGWHVDTDFLQAKLGVPVLLLNDIEAHAYALTCDNIALAAVPLAKGQGAGAQGNAAFIAAGTGLGEAVLMEMDGGLKPFPCEGGHATFAASDELGWHLYQKLAERYGHVSWERVVSGGEGFANIYEACLALGYPGVEAVETRLRQCRAVGPEVALAAQQGHPTAVEVLKRFVIWYGAEAGNLCLKINARRGLFIGGGIAPKILWALEKWFTEGFYQKGRFENMLRQIPITVIVDDHSAMWGLARAAHLYLS